MASRQGPFRRRPSNLRLRRKVRKILVTVWLICFLAAQAAGDKLILTDGREFEGRVSVEEDHVEIEMEYGRLRFPKDQVLRIELKDLPKEELRKRLEAVSRTDPEALFAVARWAAGAGLKKESEEILADVIKLDPNHAEARAELGQVMIDNTWYPFDKALELARSKLEAGQFGPLLNEILPSMEDVAARRGESLALRDLQAHAQLRAGRFGEAATTFADLADKAQGPPALRYSAIASILMDNADGMYVLMEPYPPESRLLSRNGPVLKPGPASLSLALVLEAALRDWAKKEIEVGQQFMAAARELEASEPALAQLRYKKASEAFERADAVVEDIARSYRVEVTRRRIAIIRKSCDEEAVRFDATVESLGKKELTPPAYRRKVADMIRQVDTIRQPLREILTLAKPYPVELVLEVQWTKKDLAKMDEIRAALVEELNAVG